VDYGGVKGDCANNAGISVQTYVDGSPQACKSPTVWNVDMTLRYKANDQLTVYGDILNVLDLKAKFDPASTYQIFGFNPSWSTPNIIGRYFRLGVKYDL
jgi:iron complex outermembrane receptor protein